VDEDSLKVLLGRGLSVEQIAKRFGRDASTVSYWMKKLGLEAPGREKDASKGGIDREMLEGHGLTDFVIEGRGYYRCKLCRVESVVAHRRSVKAQLVEEAGGRCAICGYDRYLGALEFHHLDPLEKRLGLSHRGVALAISTLRAEAAKCVLLCSNCHAEVEGGVSTLALKSGSRRVEDVADG
jgi:hypothetical protein